MHSTEPGYYWLHRADSASAVGRYENGLWAIIGVGGGITTAALTNARLSIGHRMAALRPKQGGEALARDQS